MRHLLVGSALATLLLSCGGNSLPELCSVTPVSLGSNALTLNPEARLDRVGTDFVLFATEKDAVLAAPIGPARTLGAVATIPVPAHTDGPWVGAVGASTAPGGALVVAYAANPAGGMADLMTFTVGIDGAAASTPVAVGQIPDKGTPGTNVFVAAGSGRGGQHMGLAWGVSGTTTISGMVLGADGRQVGAPLSLGMVDDFDCLRFTPGTGDLTVSYIRIGGTPPEQRLFLREIDASGALGTSFNLALGTLATSCAAVTPTSTGYGLAWKELGTQSDPGRGDFFTLFDQAGGSYFPYLVLSNPRAVGGSAPPIVGVGTVGNKFTLLFAHGSGAEGWEVDFQGRQTAQPLTFPSSHSNTGTVSTQPVGSSLFATYADYASADPSNQTAGDRLFVEMTCR
jgi:hypothetical protein